MGVQQSIRRVVLRVVAEIVAYVNSQTFLENNQKNISVVLHKANHINDVDIEIRGECHNEVTVLDDVIAIIDDKVFSCGCSFDGEKWFETGIHKSLQWAS